MLAERKYSEDRVDILVDEFPTVAAVSEADHRIANSLALVSSLLRLQAREIAKSPVVPGASAHRALEEAAGRIDAVGHLHRMLSGQSAGGAVDAGAYLQRVIDGTTGVGARKGSVQVFYDLSDGVQLDSERTTALALLACEAITNSLKHAHPSGVAGEIRVAFRRLGAEYLLVIEDDGVGLPEGFSASTDGGLGFRTIRELCKQLSARLTYQSTPLGLRTEVLFAL